MKLQTRFFSITEPDPKKSGGPTRMPTPGWDEQRVKDYFKWAKKVVAGLRGTNKVMEDELDKVFRNQNV